MSFSGWKPFKISEVGKVITGKTPPTSDKQNFDGVYPFITPVDMNGQKHIQVTNRYLSETGKQLLRNNLLPPNAVCVSCIGSDLGKVVKTTVPSFSNQQINSVICNDDFDPDFVYYALTLISPEIRSTGHHSTAVPIVNKSTFSEFEIKAPLPDEQRRIASILSSLDDKIELNRQTNQTLEAMAQALFTEMCLPKGEGLPAGWRVEKLGDFYKTTSGGTPSRSKMEFYENGTINWVKSKELGVSFVLDTEEKITETALKQSSAKLLPVNSVMLAMYGATVGEISILGMPASSNQAICSILPNDDYPFSFVYEFLKSQKENLKNMAVGGAQQNISQAVIQGLEMTMPSTKALKDFHLLASPIYDSVKCRLEEIQTLTYLRDGLLPKLMKGEIEIVDL